MLPAVAAAAAVAIVAAAIWRMDVAKRSRSCIWDL